MAPRKKLDEVIGALIPSLGQQAPHSVRRMQHQMGAVTEVRMVDANWTERDGHRFAVGSMLCVFTDTTQTFGQAFVESIAPFYGEFTSGFLDDAAGNRREGFFFEGSLGQTQLARAFACPQPENSTVTFLIAAVHGLQGWVDEDEARKHFDAMFALARLRPGKLSTRRESMISERLIFDFEGAIAEEEFGQLIANGFDGFRQLAYLEVPAGLFDIAEASSPVFTLDAKRQFCFLEAFARTVKPKKRFVSVGGLPEKLPAHAWTESDDTEGVAFVRDDVLHHFAFKGFDEAQREALLASLRLRGSTPDALIESPRHALSRSMFRPMSESFASVRKRFEKQQKKGKR
jgi:hypothetical protein